ncbi:EthD domain-containing protein [Streptomyces sp. NPDC013178]|uniref:EthD domain-containing protein n=1 Tax=Streptomyces sp. NPDC013178 TaxID=3155118 RepID=UPI0034057F56
MAPAMAGLLQRGIAAPATTDAGAIQMYSVQVMRRVMLPSGPAEIGQVVHMSIENQHVLHRLPRSPATDLVRLLWRMSRATRPHPRHGHETNSSDRRDRPVFKDYIVVNIRDRSRSVEMQDYAINQHAAIVMKHAPLRKAFRRFIINRVVQPETLSSPLLYAGRTEIPLIVEHACDSAALFREALQDEEYKAVIGPDEEYMGREFLSGPPIVVEMDEKVIFSEPCAGQYRVFDILKRRPDVAPADFSAWLDREGDLLAGLEDFRKAASRRVHNHISTDTTAVYAEDGGAEASTGGAFDGVVETWAPSLDDLALFYPEMRRRHADYVDAEASFSVIATEHVFVTDQA